MITYSQTKGKRFIDWNKRLSKKKKDITDKMWEKWIKDANNWVTCACGNQCSIIARDHWGRPEDKELSNLGYVFTFNIRLKDLSGSRKTLKAIENRSAEIIKQINHEK